MRFRFCGDLPAPSWLLREVPTLAGISSVRVKLLVKQVLAQMLEGGIDYQKVLRFTTQKDAEHDASATQATLAALRFVLASAAKYDIDDATLTKELEQLGLPRENAAAILRPYRESRAALRAKFHAETFALGKIISADCTASGGADGDARLRLTLAEQLASSENAKARLDFDVPAEKLAIFAHELNQAFALLESLE
ncbi:COMM domain-containing protein 4 [Pelagophyceae sp. CCMP2097]|nr:COMM domain-containing protein 4 [Pelagophyceae sp. CCMP2097]|mmetsp:Transcript_2996/g.8948  ORF Transcript_2996/g.8948 Transcript_2996/m.8948 type:complete len:196 (-) Transcript_2996:31-618(-)